MVVRTMLISGCCAVRDAPAVWVWKRIQRERSFFAPKRSFSSRAQMRRAARYLAISSKKSLCALKKNERRGANSSMSMPRAMPQRTYSSPSPSVNASSCAAVDPASRMWYPLIEIVFHCGTFCEPNSIVSTTSLIDGSGGKIYRSEEHTSELQSHSDLVCRLLLEKKKKNKTRFLPEKKTTQTTTKNIT